MAAPPVCHISNECIMTVRVFKGKRGWVVSDFASIYIHGHENIDRFRIPRGEVKRNIWNTLTHVGENGTIMHYVDSVIIHGFWMNREFDGNKRGCFVRGVKSGIFYLK
jgi:hypothetical protein